MQNPTGPSIQDSSINTSFDMNCFSFGNEEGSGYYAMIGPDGQANSLIRV